MKKGAENVKKQKLKLDKNFTPIPSCEGDEIYPNGIFNFNISKILELIETGELGVEEERIDVRQWFKKHLLNIRIQS